MREGSTAPLVKSLRRKTASHNNSSKVSATSTNSGSRMAWIDIMSFLSASTWRHLPALSKLNAERGFVVLVDEGGKPGFLLLQGGEIGLGAGMGEVGADQQPTRPQQPAHLLEKRPRRGEPIEKRHVVAGIEPAHHFRELTLMHHNVPGHAMHLDLLARQPHVLAIARWCRSPPAARHVRTTAPCSRARCRVRARAAHWPPPPARQAARRCRKSTRRRRAGGAVPAPPRAPGRRG